MADTQNELSLKGLRQNLTDQGHKDSFYPPPPDDGKEEKGNYLSILPPGIALDDINDFLKNTLKGIDDSWDILPESLPVGGVHLASLNFSPKGKDDNDNVLPFKLDFTVNWKEAEWEMIPGILSLGQPSITVNITGKSFATDSLHVYGLVSGIIKIKEIPIFIEVELPGGAFQAKLHRVAKKMEEKDGKVTIDWEENKDKAKSLTQSFQVKDTSPKAKEGEGFDVGALTLNDLTVMGSVEARRVLLHLALGEIELGPGKMAVELSIDYLGGKQSQVSGQVFGQYDIKNKEDKDLFSLMLLAGYDGPSKSWKFEGGGSSTKKKDGGKEGEIEAASINELIGVFTDADGMPGIFDNLGVKYLHLGYETGSGNFEFQCDVEVSSIFGDNSSVEMIVDVHLQKATDGQGGDKPAKYEKTFSGRLIFRLPSGAAFEFDLVFDQSPSGKASKTSFIAAYKSQEGMDINIGDLIRVIDPDLDLPLKINLKDAFFIYDKTEEKSNSLFGLDIGGGIDMAAIPLIGKVLPKDVSLNFDIQPRIAFGKKANGKDPSDSPYFTESELARLTQLVPGGGILLPVHDITDQVGVGITIAMGKDLSFQFDLPIEMKKKDVGKKPTGDGSDDPPPQTKDLPPVGDEVDTKKEKDGEEKEKIADTPTSPQTSGTTAPPSNSSASGIQWVKVGKSFGPVKFDRIGLQFEPKAKGADDKTVPKVWAYLDAGLKIGPLTFTLYGLGMGTPINKLDPEFTLLGLGLDYQAGPVQIGAAFLRMKVKEKDGPDGEKIPAHDEYSGLATIQTAKLGLAAIGSYAELPDYKSLFIFAALNMPIGGPSFFFVTGLAAGFGYNRAIKTPEVALVGQFPLVNIAVGGLGSEVPEEPTGRADYIHDILDRMGESIYPTKGEYFLAAGLRFSTFQLIDTFALLIVSFGKHFEVDLFGLSTASIPPPVPSGQAVTPIAEIQLAMKAVFNPSEGILSVEGQLTNNSFILDRDCHLTGGFAFYSWFDGPHRGDFVLTVGGYHPDFRKPDHYPSVPRLGLNWRVTEELSIKGGIYFALCSHMLMAGGKLEAMYHSGAKKAWFTLGADFLVCWKPYHYDAKVFLDVGVEYTYHCFGTHHINTHLNAEVHVWGPDFAGHAHVHLWCVTFDVDFGAKSTPKLEPINWETFRKSFLPKEESKMVNFSVSKGLIRKEKVQKDEGQADQTIDQYVINPKDFCLAIDLVIPFDTWEIKEDKVGKDELQKETVRGKEQMIELLYNDSSSSSARHGEVVSPQAFGIAPMDLDADQVSSTFKIEVKFGDDDGEDEFGFRPVLKRMPRALWGTEMEQEMNGEQYVENVLAGVELVPKNPPKPGETQWVPKHDLQYSTTHLDNTISFETITAFEASDQEGAIDLRSHLVSDSITKQRKELLQALGFDYDELKIQLSTKVADSMVMPPQMGHLV